MTLAFLRWSLAAVLMFPFAYGAMRADWPVIRQNWKRMLLLGFMGSGIYNTLQYIALTETTATNAAILNSWGPILIVIAGASLFGDRLRATQIIGMLVSLVGVAVVVLHGEVERISTLAFNRGDLVMLFATGVWALYTALLRTRPPISTMSFAGVTYVIAGFVNLCARAGDGDLAGDDCGGAVRGCTGQSRGLLLLRAQRGDHRREPDGRVHPPHSAVYERAGVCPAWRTADAVSRCWICAHHRGCVSSPALVL
jgi:uncharacterized membrane protein